MPTAPIILLVDDEVLIAEIVGDALTDRGFAVIFANDAAAALDLIATTPAIDALVTDINMGSGADGWHLARCARTACPTLPVVYTTGGAAAEFASHGVDDSVLVVKPFDVDRVVAAVTHLLDKAATTN